MDFLKRLFFLLLIGLVGFAAAVFAASEYGGEVITLRTFREDGLARETPLWIVDDRHQLYIRAGQPTAEWFARLKASGRVQVVRNGVEKDYKPVVVPRMRDHVNELMARKYGWADQVVGLMRDESQSVPIRLDPT